MVFMKRVFWSPTRQLIEVRVRLIQMSETQRPTEYPAPQVSEADTRQAKTGLGVRYVLMISLSAAIIALAAIYVLFGF